MWDTGGLVAAQKLLQQGTTVDAIPVLAAMHQRPPPQAGRAISYILANLKSRQLDIVALLLQVRCRYAVAFDFEQSHLDLPHTQVGQRNGVQNGLGWLCVSLLQATES